MDINPATGLMTQKAIAYIGLGANLGYPMATLKAAIQELEQITTTQVLAKSSFYRTAPIDADGDDYVNAVVQICTELIPEQLLLALQNIEQLHGRIRTYQNAPRTLDCDLLLHGQTIMKQHNLQIPHPRMCQRAFVLVPLLEINPNCTIPQIGKASDCYDAIKNQVIQKLDI